MERMDYSVDIKRFYLKLSFKSPWIIVGETTKTQGWKLHISTVPCDANRLLDTVLPELKKRKVCFKFIENSNQLIRLNTGLFGSTQIGKCMTIYPNSDIEAKELAIILAELTKGFKGPIVETDVKISDVVYARYGAFKSMNINNIKGKSDNYIVNNDGELIKDQYHIPFTLPKGIVNIFKNYTDKTLKKGSRLIGSRYLLIDSIHSHPKGGVGLVFDIRNQTEDGLKVIKQAKPYCMSDFYNRDGRSRLKYQENLHKKLYKLLSIPRADDYFEDNGIGYLPLEYIKGKTLKEVIESETFNDKKRGFPLNKNNNFLRYIYIVKICDFLIRLHQLGYVHRDLTPTNIIINNHDNSIRIIDFELTRKIGDMSPIFQGYTEGFASPQQIKEEQPSIQDDIYSLGCIMIFILTGKNPNTTLKTITKKNSIFSHGIISQELLELIKMCTLEDANLRPNLQQIKKQIKTEIKNIQNIHSNMG
ncbi:protein kinase [Bacillus thuringiensis]|uniref:class III lanthionine synthetase LanKC N-terminal domain-containing protein n=1 Tax=Bacillus thuringiensis TaxID=1428 RepID=UPI00124CD0E8|nr:protein kinase [Bacillus thuringiensis]KAB2364584.1 protein kinase [Bacillus thuringiensis]